MNLFCNSSYVFNLDYRKGERRSNASVTVSLKPGEPAEVKLEQRRTEKRIIVMGYIKTKSSANISWSCIEKEGTLGFSKVTNIRADYKTAFFFM